MDVAEVDSEEGLYTSFVDTEEEDESDDDFSLDSSPTATAQAPRSGGKKRGPGAISKQYSRQSSKQQQQHIQAQLTDTQLAAEVAEAVGLPPHRFGEHEQGVLREGDTSGLDDMYYQVCAVCCWRVLQASRALPRQICCRATCSTALWQVSLPPTACMCADRAPMPACLCPGPQLHSCPVAV
jgi:hypothetical protein